MACVDNGSVLKSLNVMMCYACVEECPVSGDKESIYGSSRHGSVVNESDSVSEDMGLIPDLAQWVKDQTLLQAVVSAPDMTRIWHCLGFCVAWQL